ncbi:conserved exported hypothetical protein [Frankia canadensis]|uniref:Secreted protein n=1 Tax=Frankia canadensis TaxID=1836972 RepID=A0A2I2KQY7_9ACTN|nr:hypothetical protein [Frankia canadensis]SNQ48056.1 conserved exported hypothetical protein [Frankia canadensis]SOU55346.1 conserved exported hypothetical protein [Frankia canadensis]
MSRIFYLAFGAAGGVVVVRQAAKAAAALTPTSLAGSFVQSVQEFFADVREAAAEREEEIRGALGLDRDPDDPAPPAPAGLPEDVDDLERTMRLVPGARRP